MTTQAVVRQELNQAVPALLDRGLSFAATWCVADSQQQQQQQQQQPIFHSHTLPRAAELAYQCEPLPTAAAPPAATAAASPALSPPKRRQCFTQPRAAIEESVQIAKCYFDLKEYRRAAYLLEEEDSDHAAFLRGYATFMAGEQRKEEEMLETGDALETAKVVNRELPALLTSLTHRHRSRQGGLDGHLLYLYALVLRELDQPAEARKALVASVNAWPWNWSAWRALAVLCTDAASVSSLGLSEHWMMQFFLADVLLELHQHTDNQVLRILDTLGEQFPQSTHVLAQTAVAHYNKRDFDEAQELFEELREVDPYRLDNLDTYSNILYVKEAMGPLSFLAQQAAKHGKYRPQTCCIIANYYSLKQQHEKAVVYFKRALKLDPHYLSAWTLMGHEYVEMRNTNAAIEAYRRAVDINPRDFRAWYGLGQTYEILQMHTYSLYYFRKATKLRPYDPRMWCAMAECYERLGRIEDAIKCFRHAEGNQDHEGIALVKLGQLYRKMGDATTAAHYYRKVLARRAERGEDGALESVDSVDALMFLAEFCKQRREWAEAERLCSRLLDVGGSVKDNAQALLLEIRQLAQ